MRETVYLGRDNTIELELSVDGTPLTASQMQAITRLELIYNGQTISSETEPDAFDWSTREAQGVVILALGSVSMATGTDLAADLIVYSSDNPNGIKWPSFTLKVEQG